MRGAEAAANGMTSRSRFVSACVSGREEECVRVCLCALERAVASGRRWCGRGVGGGVGWGGTESSDVL